MTRHLAHGLPAAVAAALLLSACGGSDDSDGRIREQQQGQFVDSLVAGLGYTNPDGSQTGETASTGVFRYFAGDTVSFRLDCIPLGSVSGQPIITPRTLGVSANADSNIARLLLSLDDDGNNANGIDVRNLTSCPSGLTTAIFDVDPAEFGTTEPLKSFIEANASANTAAGTDAGELVSPAYAEEHLSNSEEDIAAGRTPDGIAGAGPAISIDQSASETEGNGPANKTITFMVTLSSANPFADPVTVDFATAADTAGANPATATVDYTPASGTLSFARGENSKSIPITIIGDTQVEPGETFLVKLSDASANATLAAAQGVGTITNDDVVNPDDPSLSIADAAAVTEGDSGTTDAVFTVTLTHPPAGDVTVNVTTAQDTGASPAAAGADYNATPAPASLTLNAATPTRQVRVAVIGDELDESNETFLVKLTGASVAITDDTGLGTITDDDTAPPPPPVGDDAQGIVGCLLTQDPEICQAALESLQNLQDCPPDESGFNCAYNVLYGAVGVRDAAEAVSDFIAQCNDTPLAPGCEAIRNTGGLGDTVSVAVASDALRRGDLLVATASPIAPTAKTMQGDISDWTGTGSRIGGTALYSHGEHIYTDFLFDAFGADNGEDARRLAVLALAGQINSRTERVDALQQAGGDQLGVPQPAGSRADHYGDATNREEGLDLTEVRWGANASHLNFLARVARLTDATNFVVVILADTDATRGMTGLNAGLNTGIFDRAVVLDSSGGRLINLTTGSSTVLGAGAVAVSAGSYSNALEAAIPRAALARADGSLRVAVMTARKSGDNYIPANLAYRFDEPVTIYNERAQALSLFAGNVDGFTATIALSDLSGGTTQTARPGPGYHERQFTSGANISVESDSENGRLQPYGLFVPTTQRMNDAGQTRLTFWTHYRGGKAHSGAAWTPRLISQLGEEQGNIVVTPRARGTSTWYTTRAHQDVFEVFADIAGTAILGQYAKQNLPDDHEFGAEGLFNIDPSRVYMSGYSMGGYATYLFTGLYPDLFAAGYSTSGAVTQGAWTGIGPDPDDPGTGQVCDLTAPDDTPEVGGGTPCFIEANNGRANAQLNYRILDNTRHVPLTIHHGSNDELALTPGALRMGQRLLELQYRYDATTFLGYEHFTQAIMDEWRDGAVFMNQYARPENPRVVTYKVVPALVKAVNEVQLNGLNGGQPFHFNPDGAYWVDEMLVRDGADGANPSAFAQIDATSLALAANRYVPVPRSGSYVNSEAPQDSYVSTPVFSPGNHSTPYVRHGLEWLDLPGQMEPVSNSFSATLTNLLASTLDTTRMGLRYDQRIDGTVQSDDNATLILSHIGAAMTLCVNGVGENVPANSDAVAELDSGANTIALLPGLNRGCAGGAAAAYQGGVMGMLERLSASLQLALAQLMAGEAETAFGTLQLALAGAGNDLGNLLFDDPTASVVGTAENGSDNPADGEGLLANVGELVSYFLNDDRVRAGVGVVDMTPDVGYGAGQYSDKSPDTPEGEIDPYATHKSQKKSYGVVSRLSARAIVVEGSNGQRVALLKSDNYLAQDNLLRRVGQILRENNSSIGYDQILHHVSHAHSTTYVSTLAAGVFAFQDAYDARFFENQARKLAQAILTAEANLKPARMGATTVRHKIFKGQIVGPTSADDGTPAGYPHEYGDLGLVVMRFEEDNAQRTPIAVWVNWGEHPEGLDGYDLHSADYVAYLERFVERDIGVPLVFSQGDVGSAEKSGNDQQRLRDDGTVCNDNTPVGESCPTGEGVWRDWNHKGYVQNERNVRYLADAVVKGWKVIGGELPVDALAPGIPPNNYVPEVQVALSGSFPVDYRNGWVPGPLSHPYPAVSNCRSERTVQGDTGVPVAGLPDCAREGIPGANPLHDQAHMLYATAKAEGLPVPEHYDAPSFGALEENARLRLQAFRLGDVVLASCACEAQVDLILNFESRANNVAGDIYDGFDWACARGTDDALCVQQKKYFNPAEFPLRDNQGSLADAAKVARMRAQVHNDAKGWDAPEYVPYANAEPAASADDPTDFSAIKGNFTREELPANRGYKLAVGIGHAGDYNGYTVSYREFMRGDHYRKALTAYGSHTADYMVTRLVRMAGAMNGGPELAPEPHDTAAQADELRQQALTEAHGLAVKQVYEAYNAALPPDRGPAAKKTEPADIGLFNAATFSWRGGSTALDNPFVIVERCVDGASDACTGGSWQRHADQTGEVQTRVQWPVGVPGVAMTYAGQQEWIWTANFEAYEAFPAQLGGTPAGEYRFVVSGCINDDSDPAGNGANRLQNLARGVGPVGLIGDFLEANGCRGGAAPYTLTSNVFQVAAAADVVSNVVADATGDIAFNVSPTSIPRSYASIFPYVQDDGGARYCKECSFRPWATANGAIADVSVTVGGIGKTVSGAGATRSADTDLAVGQAAVITVTYNDGRISRPFTFTRTTVTPPPGTGLPQIPPGGIPPDGIPTEPPPMEPVVVGPLMLDPENQCGEFAGQGGCLSDLGL